MRRVDRPSPISGSPYLDFTAADPVTAVHVAEYLYAAFRSGGYWTGEYVTYDLRRVVTVAYALRYVVPRLVREDGNLSDDQRSSIRQHFIMADRGADFLTPTATPGYLEMLDVASAHIDEFLKFVRYDNKRPNVE